MLTSFFLISYAIILPFLIVNGFLTSLPVITYNDVQNIELHITTIRLKMYLWNVVCIDEYCAVENLRTKNITDMEFGRVPESELDSIDFTLPAEPAFNKQILKGKPLKP